MERRSVIINETVHVCLELYTLFLSITLAQLKNPNDEECPPGRHSWCSYNREISSGTNYHQPIKNPLPPAAVVEIQPRFDRLGSKKF